MGYGPICFILHNPYSCPKGLSSTTPFMSIRSISLAISFASSDSESWLIHLLLYGQDGHLLLFASSISLGSKETLFSFNALRKRFLRLTISFFKSCLTISCVAKNTSQLSMPTFLALNGRKK